MYGEGKMKNIRKIWIVGANGRVGRAINKLLDSRTVEILNTDINEVDITDIQSVIAYGDIHRPDVIINCAALTSIEECERFVEKAYKVNALGARNLSISARKIRARIVHISTDDVFDGKGIEPYTEFDVASPRTIYGKSKLAGENFVKEFAQKYIIIRSSWTYGEGENFVNSLLELARTNDVVRVAKDQFGSPTSAHELAKLIIYLMNTSEYGLYHGACLGSCSRYEFAKEIFKLAKIETKVEAVETHKDELSASRPAYTVLDNFMLRIADSYQMPHWKEALATYINK